MFTVDWSVGEGWKTPLIRPYGPLAIPVSATSTHYGISCYEGFNVMKNSENGEL